VRSRLGRLRRTPNRILMSIARHGIGTVRTHARKLPFWIKSPLKRFLSITSQTTKHENSISESYDRWVKEFDTLSDFDRDKIRAHTRHLKYRPLISVIMPVYETPEWVLREAIDSIRHQLYPNWELCIADDASASPHIDRLLRQVAAEDSRIKWIRRKKNGHISAASNSAFSLAVGEFAALMDHDDLLAQHALYEVAVALNEDPTFDIIYSDEDQIDAQGRRSLPYFKTDWNIDLLLGHNMISHLGVYRRTLLERVGGFREGFEGSQDYDVALRCADATIPGRICHIPCVLYHWRRNYGATSFSEGKIAGCSDAALRAIRDHLNRLNEVGKVEPHPTLPQWSRVIRPLPNPSPLVSLIVPTRDRTALLGMCVNGLLNRTDYPEFEVLIIDHASELPETFELFERLKLDPRVRILSHTGPFNYSAMNNLAVAQAKGSIIGLINNDIDVINSDWLPEMVSLAVMNDVGAVGAKLIYPGDRVQHGGVVLGVGGVANHFNHLLSRWDPGYFGRNLLTSSVSAVTGACLVVRRSVFEEVGGLNEIDLAVAFNDVDFCLRLRKRGYRNIWTPHAELYHHESTSRGADNTPETSARFRRETQYMLATWGPELEHDPFYNDNFSTEIGRCFQLAFPPRRQKSWIQASKQQRNPSSEH
jgi:O-antigen biosynthesis protein